MTITQLNNRYKVIQVLGAGGFGETFLAEDTHMPSRRRCVIKQLKPVTNDPQTYKMIQQRFEREAATLELLGEGSDQIPKLYAYFSEHGQFYLVQEWIQGQTLTNLVETEGSISENKVREILLSLLSVLDYVHSKGIIHRDIKPDNIILRTVNNQPVLIDFGAVKETIRSIIATPNYLTQSLVIGTPGYMPSEQAVGRPVYATDIYSLGLTAIYLLTGKPPHELPTNPQTGEVIWQDLVPGVSPQLAMILKQATQPQASDRYSTASKMLHALQSASTIPPTSYSSTQSTIALSPAVAHTQQTQPLASAQKSAFIPASTTSNSWQKPAVIFGSLVMGGLIAGIAIANITRQPPIEATIDTNTPPETTESPIATNPPSTPSSVAPSTEPTDAPVASQPPLIPASPQQPETSTFTTPPVVSAPQQQPPTFAPPPVAPPPEDSQTAAVPTPKQQQPAENPTPATPTPPPPPENQPKVATANTSSLSVPAYPTGTSEDTVKSTLGKPTKVSRGLWNTRAYLYRLHPNQVDLGYLFDRKTGVLRQTEVSFAQSVPPQVMQSTLQGMLGGNASGEINQALQRVHQRQINQYSFSVGGVEGVIQRNQEDQIYIGVWDADLH
ncbi:MULTISPECIES: serine/threonine-protein kinase [Fischerella]|uniref:non-specific serine/threonine protein kinase n=1 Tax=Fischerella muscicola CCMEE 5323 TaxID=2019572 RepID=A0A2N6JWV8_FISMU|nr:MULTISPECIES: serine/threonine-protein kinase [Fischerella]MBD2430317.1 protein kinase [Fischerella sp. FACHB-380]PLZ84730.1 serine/threonine protein kinase [Fischerella muscicola CCMEE 5323]